MRLAAAAVLLFLPSALGLGVLPPLAVAAAVAIAWVVRTRNWFPVIGFISSAFDVTLATFVAFDTSFLALAATSLRYDPRICVFAGVLAMIEYAALGGSPPRLALLGVAALLSFAMVRRAQRLQDVSTKDGPTGVSNRLHFERALEVEVARALSRDRPMAVAILGIDQGSPASDQVLRQLGARLTAGLRRTDIVARRGEEELVILMTETTSRQASSRIEQLRRVMATESMNFSAGVAGMSGKDDRLRAATMLDRADAKLLAAKRAGGGCVVSDEA